MLVLENKSSKHGFIKKRFTLVCISFKAIKEVFKKAHNNHVCGVNTYTNIQKIYIKLTLT